MIRIDFVLNNRCNFKCPYCCGGLIKYQSNNYILPVNISRFTYYFGKYVKNMTNVEFNFLGGEPLLYKDLDKIYYILFKCDFSAKINIDTNGSIIIPDKVINAMILCQEKGWIVEVNLSYHKIMLESSRTFMNNYYQNISILLDNNIPVIVKMLYNKTEYTDTLKIINNFIEKFPKLFIEWR